MFRYEIIQSLIDKNGFNSYAEIGVEACNCYNRIQIKEKCGCDTIHTGENVSVCTSDNFFLRIGEKKFDIVFIDGLHEKDTVLRDIENSLKHLNENGIIVVHDCIPVLEVEQHVPFNGISCWYGDVWKAFALLRIKRNDLKMHVIDTDCGCGIISRGSQELYPATEDQLNWNLFQQKKNELMNVITVEEFRKLYLTPE